MDPFLYQYSVGGGVFFLGAIFAWKQGYFGVSGSGLRNLVVALGGLAIFAGVQGFLQYAPMQTATGVAYSGPPFEHHQLGTPLDYAIMIGYFGVMLGLGTWYGRNQKTTRDFFYGGQRFSWWLIAASLIATTIGSYSFVKYSAIAYTWGLASTQTYLNDWFWVPFLLFGWVPILYFSRVVSIPEYFARRFGPSARHISTALLLVYLVGYVGINLFTMGQAVHILVGWPVFTASAVVALISAVYVTFGGQTSVIMTDLFQGVMLLATGLVLLVLGVIYLGGPELFWEHLPRAHRMAFSPYNADPTFPAVGIFWQDGIANSAMFYFLNQGMVMRLMSARTVDDSRKAMIVTLLVLMPLAAIVVASGGWVARALVHAGHLPEMPPKEAFFVTAEFLSRPGVFGMVMAALVAALMSTVDSLITAIAAIIVNDVYQPLRPAARDEELLRVARWASVSITLLGVALVPVFMSFGSIYSAHGAFTAAITPPLVVALLLGVFWRRYTPAAAVATMLGGISFIALSIVFPQIIEPIAHGVPTGTGSGTLLGGADQQMFMRALFGLLVSGALGVSVTLVTRPRPLETIKGLVWGTVSDAIALYKGSPGVETESAWALATPHLGADDLRQNFLPIVHLSAQLAAEMEAQPRDLVYITDLRGWTGGLRSSHAIVGSIYDEPGKSVHMGASVFETIAGGRETQSIHVKRLY